MAKASEDLIQSLRVTARNIERNSTYQWGHMGACNCGFLAQEVTKLTKDEIHRRAMERYGNWSEHLNSESLIELTLRKIVNVFASTCGDLCGRAKQSPNLRIASSLPLPALALAMTSNLLVLRNISYRSLNKIQSLASLF